METLLIIWWKQIEENIASENGGEAQNCISSQEGSLQNFANSLQLCGALLENQ